MERDRKEDAKDLSFNSELILTEWNPSAKINSANTKQKQEYNFAYELVNIQITTVVKYKLTIKLTEI